jgi:N-acetyl-anhydromuramyl-L-alanine amidase AmpD
MKRIILHWTAGQSCPNHIDVLHYHFLIDSSGKIHYGKFKPEDNLKCFNGKYAAHTGGGNTGSIGIAVCGMLGFQSPEKLGNYPLTKIQMEVLYNLVAQLCIDYKIPITKNTVMTHYEFGQKNPRTTSYGKIDITYTPTEPNLLPDMVGEFIRNKIQWYYNKKVGTE